MGQPQHRDNVRRVDFAAKPPQGPGEPAATKPKHGRAIPDPIAIA
jgi:hypothetical protein